MLDELIVKCVGALGNDTKTDVIIGNRRVFCLNFVHDLTVIAIAARLSFNVRAVVFAVGWIACALDFARAVIF